MAINVTGQLTIGDGNNIGNNSNYLRIDFYKIKLQINDILNGPTEEESLVVNTSIWKTKTSFNNKKKPLQPSGEDVVNEIKGKYIISAAEILTAPSSNFNALSGTSLYDKFLYWITQKVSEKIIADNPTFTTIIVDIN